MKNRDRSQTARRLSETATGEAKTGGRNAPRRQSAGCEPEPGSASRTSIPDWTEPGEDGKPFFKDIGKTEPAPIKGEIRRHLYRRDGNVVRVKIKYQTADGARWTNAYLVRRPSDGAIGWQAKKPEGFVPGPYIGAADPFDPEMADDFVFSPKANEMSMSSLATACRP